MVNINELSGPVRTVADTTSRKISGIYHVALKDVGVDPKGELWLRADGKLRADFSTFRQVIAFSANFSGNLSVYGGSEVAIQKMKRLIFPVDQGAWIKVHGTF